MHAESIELLNKAVADELAAIHQYMYFHFHCDDQGFDLLADLFRRTAIEEMLHAERLAERILFLKGEVDLSTDQKVQLIHDVEEMLARGREAGASPEPAVNPASTRQAFAGSPTGWYNPPDQGGAGSTACPGPGPPSARAERLGQPCESWLWMTTRPA